jgi:hypothetical protein
VQKHADGTNHRLIGMGEIQELFDLFTEKYQDEMKDMCILALHSTICRYMITLHLAAETV